MADSFFCVICDDCGASTQLRLAPAGRLRPGGGFSIKGDRSSLARRARVTIGTRASSAHPREEEMDAIPLEVWTAFQVIAVGGLLILAVYIINSIINKWRK